MTAGRFAPDRRKLGKEIRDPIAFYKKRIAASPVIPPEKGPGSPPSHRHSYDLRQHNIRRYLDRRAPTSSPDEPADPLHRDVLPRRSTMHNFLSRFTLGFLFRKFRDSGEGMASPSGTPDPSSRLDPPDQTPRPAPETDLLLTPLDFPDQDHPVEIVTNWRWLLGGVLATVVIIALIGATFYFALGKHHSTNPSTSFSLFSISQSNLSQMSDYPALNPAMFNRQKEDRESLSRKFEEGPRVLRQSVITRSNGREVIEIKPHINLIAGLVIDRPTLTADLPPFDPFLFLDNPLENSQPPPSSRYDGAGREQVVVTLADMPHPYLFQDTLPQHEDRDGRALTVGLVVSPAHAARNQNTPSSLFDGIFSTSRKFEPFGDNITRLEKITPMHTTSRIHISENSEKTLRILTIDADIAIDRFLSRHFVPDAERSGIIEALIPAIPSRKFTKGDSVRIAFGGSSDQHYPTRLSVFRKGRHLTTVGLVGFGSGRTTHFVPLEDSAALPEIHEGHDAPVTSSPGISLYRSIFETGRRNGIPDAILKQFVHIHAYHTDFKRTSQLGDTFSILYVADKDSGAVLGTPKILYSSLTLNGETKGFYGFTAENDVTDYYDETGRSSKMFLLQKPVPSNKISSSFGYRIHPVLKQRKLHTGIDLVAPAGTPIVAAGDGIVEQAQWVSGYGYYTVIRHANGYESAYGHQSGFAENIKKGTQVRQGQVIGYVGSTGRSTGPHLHYELRVNGQFVDPMRLKFPRNKKLQGSQMQKFVEERNRIESLISKDSRSRLAHSATTISDAALN